MHLVDVETARRIASHDLPHAPNEPAAIPV